MSRARNLADLLDSNGDVVSGALDNVPPSNDASALTTGTLPVERVPYVGRRNLIINGAMQVAQRGTSSTSNNGYSTVDRLNLNLSGTITSTQSSDAPEGFSNSYKLEVTGAANSGATGIIWSNNEGQNFQMLKYGTANAETMSLSFWVKSSIAGRYTVNLLNRTTSVTFCTNSYTIDSANTWEYKTLTFVGDTSKSIENSNNNIIDLEFWTNTGSSFTSGTFTDGGTAWTGTVGNRVHPSQVNVLETSGATWQITGVQLEVGSVATPFEHRSYGEELALCQRYYFKSYNDGVTPGTVTSEGRYYTTVDGVTTYASPGPLRFPVTMRATPTITFYSPTTGESGKMNCGGTKNATLSEAGMNGCGVYVSNNSSGVSAGSGVSCQLTAEAEL